MKEIICFVISLFAIFSYGCRYNIGVPNSTNSYKGDSLEYSTRQIKDSVYHWFFGSSDPYVTPIVKYHDVRVAGDHKVPIIKYWGKSKPHSLKKQLTFTRGFYIDTVEAGIINKYQMDKTTAWLNSASVFGFVPTEDTIRLCGEGYFETTGKELTVLIEDTIKIIVRKNSKVNVSAYKIPLSLKAEMTLFAGEIIVLNGLKVDTVSKPQSVIFIETPSGCKTYETILNQGANSWTKLKFDYSEIDLNELVERLGRRYNIPVETLQNAYQPIRFCGSFYETLESILTRVDTLSDYSGCRLSNNKIIVFAKR